MLLGNVLLYEISGHRRRADLRADAQRLGLPATTLPHVPRAIDAFRVATSEASTSLVTPDGVVDYRILETETTREYVRRAVNRQMRPTRGRRRPEVEPVGEAIFYRRPRSKVSKVVGGEKLKFGMNRGRLTAEEIAHLTRFFQKLYARYQELCVSLSPHALRTVVRETLLAWHAVQLRPGVYFVPATAPVGALCELVAGFEGRNACHVIPLPDTPQQRALVRWAASEDLGVKVAAVHRDASDARRRATWEIRWTTVTDAAQWYVARGLLDATVVDQLAASWERYEALAP